MTDAIEALLYPIFKAQGAADAAGLAHRAAKDFDMDQRDAEIYELRATMTIQAIHERTGLSIQRIKQIQKEQLALRRSNSAA